MLHIWHYYASFEYMATRQVFSKKCSMWAIVIKSFFICSSLSGVIVNFKLITTEGLSSQIAHSSLMKFCEMVYLVGSQTRH